ncbi:hypothetical protein CK224_25965 [Mesorhizobium sp. WSM3862]|nr:hypothetical protein CK224_25965 [Mesorhizobium sp. WSM3862]
MRQSHAGGEKMFVDYAGDTVPVVVDRRTGEVRDAPSVCGGARRIELVICLRDVDRAVRGLD